MIRSAGTCALFVLAGILGAFIGPVVLDGILGALDWVFGGYEARLRRE